MTRYAHRSGRKRHICLPLSLGVTEVVEAMDMDQMTNPQVRRAIQAIRREVQSIRGIRYSKYVWNPAYKGIDDYYLSRIAAQ